MVVDLFNGGIARCKQSKLWKLWKDFWEPFERIQGRFTVFEIRKVKSHSDASHEVPAEL